MAVFQCIHIYFSPLTTVVSIVFVFFSCSALFIFSFCSFTDFQSFYNILKNCRGHLGERSVFSDRTEESSAVQYFQVRGTHTHTHSCVAPVTEVTVSEDPDEPDEHSRVNILLSVVSDRLLFPFFFPPSSVLWLPLPATEHDAGLCSDRDLPTGYSPKPL